MNRALLFDFTVNKENSTIHIQREFAANLNFVWDAWTLPELLDQWWAPKPYQTITKSMDFREGGFWHYRMIGPQSDCHWCRADYEHIETQVVFSGLDAFCDEEGTINTDLPRAHWANRFTEQEDVTRVNIVITYQSLADLEKVVEMGFREGFAMAMENLDQYIQAQFQLRSEMKPAVKARVCTYLNFDGKTEEAFRFYQSVFKTAFVTGGIKRFGDLPADSNHPPVAEEIKKMVLHVELPITGNHILMGTDAPKEMGFTITQGNNMHISIEPETRAEAERLFNELSAGGKIEMPLQDMFFGAYYAGFTDKYGINWMINCWAK
ncbi:SRPBCC domain-containing protein [Sediminibacterium goheungense]|uniref:PhnB protein n=1 Tax=Sediminibacterium goheungense TaxID=1086393 RepID=A0A4R6J1I5_9BACT|nr:SRPBCC domain-containing protein [Sediminibacterium goheungense]TDO29110.1 PhnB protein [Sediminibacterium goheungense]